MQVGVSEKDCVEARPSVKVVRHVGGLLLADGRRIGRRDHDASYRVSRARSAFLSTFCRSRSRSRPNFDLLSVRRPLLYVGVGLLELIAFPCRRNIFLI